MAKKGKRQGIKMKSSESAHCYFTEKNKINTPDRIARKKYDPFLKRHVEYKEAK